MVAITWVAFCSVGVRYIDWQGSKQYLTLLL